MCGCCLCLLNIDGIYWSVESAYKIVNPSDNITLNIYQNLYRKSCLHAHTASVDNSKQSMPTSILQDTTFNPKQPY